MNPQQHSTVFNLSTLPALGRDGEVQWARGELARGDRRIVAFVAPGGVGKSEIVKCLRREWDTLQSAQHYEGLIEWSFYSQGSTDRVVSSETFFHAAFNQLGVNRERYAQLPPAARGQLLADTLQNRKFLLILDGLEPLQYGSGPIRGYFKDSGLSTFLSELVASSPGGSTALITTRVPLTSLRHPSVSERSVDLLSPEVGQQLLASLGVKGTDEELAALASAFNQHALSLALVGRYIASSDGVHGSAAAFLRVLQPFVPPPWIESRTLSGDVGANAFRALSLLFQDGALDLPCQALKLMGLFDRPTHRSALEALRTDPRIAGETVAKLSAEAWQEVLQQLRTTGLLAPEHPSDPAMVDTHPLIREFCAERFSTTEPVEWQRACFALGELFEKEALDPKAENTPQGFSSAYQAIRYFAMAANPERALGLLDRVWNTADPDRTKHFRGTRQHGLYGLELVALSSFFANSFTDVRPWVPVTERARLLSEAGIRLRNVGRLDDALQTFEAARDLVRAQQAPITRSYLQGLCGLTDMYAVLGNLRLARIRGLEAMSGAQRLAREMNPGPSAPPLSQFVLSLTRSGEVELHSFRETGNTRSLETAASVLQWARAEALDAGEVGMLESQAFYSLALMASQTGEVASFWDLHAQLQQSRAEAPSLLGRALRRLASGIVLHSEGRRASEPEAARKFFAAAHLQLREALPLLQQAGYVDYLVPGLIALARNATELGSPVEARAYLDRATQFASQANMKLYLRQLAALDSATGDE